MKRKLLFATSALFLLSACGSAPKAVNVTGCWFPDTEVAAPGWICDEPQPGVEFSAVGVAEPSNASLGFRKTVATEKARGALGKEIEVQVSTLFKDFEGTTGSGDDETVDKASEVVLRTMGHSLLAGTRVLKSLTGPKGRLYVLVGRDSKPIQNAKDRILNSSKNDQALWQKFLAEKNHEELAAEIAKLLKTEQ